MELETIDCDRLLLIYSNNAERLNTLMMKLKFDNIEICVEGLSNCIADLDRCILDTLSEYSPDFIIIDNDKENIGLNLFEMIKDEGTIDSIPTIIIGITDAKLRLKALELGALDIVNDWISQETYIKIKNYIEIGKKITSTNTHDKLTGAYKRKYAESLTKKNIVAAKGEKTSLILMLIDIEGVGEVNKKLGKAKGNQVLICCSNFFKKEMNGRDYVYRYSGGKFVLVFQNKAIEYVLAVTNSLQDNVVSLRADYGINISLSAGISVLNAEAPDYDHLINNAIKSLALAKENGKSKIYIHDSINTTKKDKHILIVDPDTVLSNILSQRYINKGYKVTSAKDMESISQLLQSGTIEVLIIDFEPFKTLQKYFKDNMLNLKNTKIIVLASSKSESVLGNALKNGANIFIQKPFSIVELDLKLQSMI
jgi:two-component system cell cycle response regulator